MNLIEVLNDCGVFKMAVWRMWVKID